MTIESTHPSFTQCPDCKRYYEGPGVPICQDTAGLTERKVCRACATRMDWQGCYLCGELDAHECIDTWLCRACAAAEDWNICDGCSKGFCDDEIAEIHGEKLCEDCREAAGWHQCTGCEGWYTRDDLSTGADGDSYCSDCWCDRFSTCDGCGEVFWNDDINYCDDSSYCNDCVPDQEEFEPRSFRGAHSYTDMPSCRKFGVELETDSCDDYQSLDGGFWGAKHDGSINGKEFYSGILYGDDGLVACRDICKFAGRHGWDVDRHCGYHAHFDMTEESDDSLKAIACAYMLTYEVWCKFVDSSRLENGCCRKHSGNIPELFSAHSFTYFANSQSREWINFRAYTKHTTFEVRLHEGTLDASAVCNWVKAHATFMDWASEAGWSKVRNTLLCMNNADKLEFIAQIWCQAGCADVSEYYCNMVSSEDLVCA